MKITFQGEGLNDIIDQMKAMLKVNYEFKNVTDEIKNVAPAPAQGPGPDVFAGAETIVSPPVETPVANPVSKPGKTRTPKQLENDEKLRERALAKKAAGLKPFDKMPKSAPAVEKVVPPPASAESSGLAPDEVVKLRQKTIADLQDAYANGHQKEVFELLSRFGNGAKSFRELPPDAFVPISEAIANGALT